MAPSDATAISPSPTTNIIMSNFFFIRTKAFQSLSKYAFKVCDSSREGKIGRYELYAAILLVHVKLAKFCGPAACSPPSPEVVNQLFDATDYNKSGYIDENEFEHIAAICCAQIASRIIVYLFALVFVVPYLSKILVSCLVKCDEWMGERFKGSLLGGFRLNQSILDWLEKILTWNRIAEKIAGILIIVYLVRTIVYSLPACILYLHSVHVKLWQRALYDPVYTKSAVN